MSKKKTQNAESGLSRRDLIRAAGAVVAAATVSPSLAQTKSGIKPHAAPSGEKPDIFKLLYLWLVVSTNPAFGTSGSLYDINEIKNYSGRPDAATLMSKMDWSAAQKAFGQLAYAFNAAYTPGECPALLTTLEVIAND
jgi:hypothetical protein